MAPTHLDQNLFARLTTGRTVIQGTRAETVNFISSDSVSTLHARSNLWF
jgi:hypothetical protein